MCGGTTGWGPALRCLPGSGCAPTGTQDPGRTTQAADSPGAVAAAGQPKGARARPLGPALPSAPLSARRPVAQCPLSRQRPARRIGAGAARAGPAVRRPGSAPRARRGADPRLARGRESPGATPGRPPCPIRKKKRTGAPGPGLRSPLPHTRTRDTLPSAPWRTPRAHVASLRLAAALLGSGAGAQDACQDPCPPSESWKGAGDRVEELAEPIQSTRCCRSLKVGWLSHCRNHLYLVGSREVGGHEINALPSRPCPDLKAEIGGQEVPINKLSKQRSHPSTPLEASPFSQSFYLEPL
ncbi:hypothetical protein NN561_013395 [Cricetulus griseus]